MYTIYFMLYLIEILHQTTTLVSTLNFSTMLYLIEILHQTTTKPFVLPAGVELYLIEILHQTTTTRGVKLPMISCILSKFYIKPQPTGRPNECSAVVSYRNSTSNHNRGLGRSKTGAVVSYRNSTSNHNTGGLASGITGLYLIEILHQTTTGRHNSVGRRMLYLIEILHQTTTGSTRGI